jgi:hypothetical protein
MTLEAAIDHGGFFGRWQFLTFSILAGRSCVLSHLLIRALGEGQKAEHSYSRDRSAVISMIL